MKLKIVNDYKDPENGNIEIVERKGIAHPDTIADKLAQECSRVYSVYCIKHFGYILHHNIDKLYVGGGLFLLENGKIKRHSKIRVELNGRVSNCMNGKKINLEKIFIPVIKKYIKSIMPRINPDEDLDIKINCTQHSKREYWYEPRDVNDIPDALDLFAADTSLCVLHGTKTFCEKLAMDIEQSFWTYKTEYAHPRYDDVGGDIKVMVSRINNDVTATVCLPVYKDVYLSENEYVKIIKKYEKILTEVANKVDNPNNYTYKVEINRNKDNNTYRNYSLVLGSCIECGEEGLVGRGNNSQGLISSFREHSVEASCGKNERYHTGRVINYLGSNAVFRINNELNIKCTLFCLTRNRGLITEPFLFYLSVDDLSKKKECEKIVYEEFNENFVNGILSPTKLF